MPNSCEAIAGAMSSSDWLATAKAGNRLGLRRSDRRNLLWDPVSGTVRFSMCYCLFHGGLLLPKTPVILLEHGSVPKNVLTLWISRPARTVVDKRWSVKGHRRGLGPCVCTLWVHTIFSNVFPLYTL